MKILLVPWALLLFGVSLNSGHYIRKAEDGESSVYQVHDDSSGITFTNPKQDRRTLREILYYHIIERPRNEPVATERSFTNGHGYQFFDLEPLLKDSYDDKYEEDDGSYVEQTEHEEKDQDAEDSEKHEEDLKLTTTQTPLTDQAVKEAYKARSYLFDQARQRYAVKRMAVPEPSLNRRKRQAETESPDPPSLDSKAAYIQPNTYGMNLNGDGGYVWNVSTSISVSL
ncbi:uncharacterized protein LOC133533044 isoform X1 [Cydia pomonella]|uniref:uncharacterized protein LOC133533044 isoform X1 n=1 Tax=Cydia pomonella TaxID=82600 RepID=UPI002ADE5370|nr:uncharacterized protein LOC133533044 isoform X1 [Cydia pomonella]